MLQTAANLAYKHLKRVFTEVWAPRALAHFFMLLVYKVNKLLGGGKATWWCKIIALLLKEGFPSGRVSLDPKNWGSREPVSLSKHFILSFPSSSLLSLSSFSVISLHPPMCPWCCGGVGGMERIWRQGGRVLQQSSFIFSLRGCCIGEKTQRVVADIQQS